MCMWFFDWRNFACVKKNLDSQTKSCWSKLLDSEAMLQAIKVNQMSSVWRVSGKLRISPSNVVQHLHNLVLYTHLQLQVYIYQY